MNTKDFSVTIIGLKNRDLALRDKLIKEGKLSDGYNVEMEDLHNKNAEALYTIIKTIGYPTVEKVGVDASNAAWLIIQHSIGHPKFMKRCEEQLKVAVIEKKASPIDLAYLSDRIAMFEGRPQEYGTQFDWDEDGKLSPISMLDIETVDQNRRSIGLNTLAEQTDLIRKSAEEENQIPPKDYQKRQIEYNNWRKKVGWI